MKNLLLLVLLTFLGFGTSFGQRFAYVDSKYILENMPAFQQAQAELNEYSKKWQETVEAKKEDINNLEKAFEAEQILLTPEMKQKRQDEIAEKKKDVLKYQRDKFGVEGELFKKRQELIQPLQDEIFKAINELAKERSYAVIFDKGTNTNMLYSDPKYDKSDVVLRKLGLSAENE